MLETFKAQLKAKSTAAGANLSNARIDAIAAKLNAKFPDLSEEADHVAKIDDLYDAEIFKDLAAADDFQRAKEKREAEKKKEVPKDKDDKKETPKNDEAVPAWAQALIDQNKALQDEVLNIKKEKTLGTIKQQATEKLKDVPASYWAKRSLPEKEEELEAFIQEVQTDYTAFKQDLVNQGLAVQTRPGGGTVGGGNAKPSDAELDKIFEKINI